MASNSSGGGSMNKGHVGIAFVIGAIVGYVVAKKM